MKNFKQIPLLHALTFQWHSNTVNSLQHSQFLLHSVTFNRSKWSHDRGHQLSRTKFSSTLSMTAASDILSGEFSSRQNQRERRRRKIAVIGGGASGMFAATAAADAIQKYGAITECDVIVFEGTSKTMSKVRISGGGRCNVMHDKTKPLPQILSSYPRGHKELRGLYTKRFTPDDAYDWFTSRGVQLKTESDGRMFPTTDNSQTIIDTITNAALRAGVEIRRKEKVNSVHLIGESGGGENGRFLVNICSKSQQQSAMEEHFDAIILATGSFPLGHEIARSLGHTIVKPVPSLFTFDAKELVKDGGSFNGLAGVSVPLARMTLKVTDEMTSSADASSDSVKEEPTTGKNTKKKRRKKATTIIQEGPLLITHHGVSGPATLRLSAFAAREFHAVNYRSTVNIHFCPQWEEEQKKLNGDSGASGEGILMDYLWEMTRKLPKRQICTGSPLLMKNAGDDDRASIGSSTTPNNMPIIPKRLWSALVQHSGIPPNMTWGDASKSMIRSLSNNISSFPLTVTSKGVFKEEFVTAGGVALKEVQMTNMESKVVPGLFICGEVLDVDGVTGGFNFMGCWSTGFIAGEGAALACCSELELIK